MRLRAVFVILLAVLIAAAFCFAAGAILTRNQLSRGEEQELFQARDIAGALVAAEAGRLESEAEAVAERLLQAGSDTRFFDTLRKS